MVSYMLLRVITYFIIFVVQYVFYSVSYYLASLRVSVFFFFKQKPAYELLISDWISDVCSSDLAGMGARLTPQRGGEGRRRPLRGDRRLSQRADLLAHLRQLRVPAHRRPLHGDGRRRLQHRRWPGALRWRHPDRPLLLESCQGRCQQKPAERREGNECVST